MTTIGAADMRELLLTAEEMVRDGWRHSAATAAADGDGSLGSTATSALNRITQIGAVLLDEQAYGLLPEVTTSLVHLYRAAGAKDLTAGTRGQPDSSLRRRDLIVRLFALGALAVQQRAFSTIRHLVLQAPEGMQAARYWIRETVTTLAREGRLEPRSLIPLATDYIAGQPMLFRRFREHQDDVVSALCQFDFLQCVIVIAESDELHEAYPSFGAYYNERTEPVVEQLVIGNARDVVSATDDATLASIIRMLDDAASQVFFSYAGWSGQDWRSEKVRAFLRAHPNAISA